MPQKPLKPLPEGIQIHGKNIRISFRYKGVLCREALKGVAITDSNIRFASNKRTVILHEIATGTFDYRGHFPESKRANLFSPVKLLPKISDALKEWVAVKSSEIRPKTLNNYQGCIDNHILPKFGNRIVGDISQSEFKSWRVKDLGHLSNKTINDIFIPLRGIYETAIADRLIDFNPLDHVTNLERSFDDNADPFSRSEIATLTNTQTNRESEKRGFLFACWSGVRVSEWMALAWEDVDFKNRQIKINRSVVKGSYAFPKTKGSHRTIDLLDQAWDILMQQKELSFMLPKSEVEVITEDNRKKRKQKLSFVFVDSFTFAPYINSARLSERFWDAFLKTAKVRYRGINQARHTFASQLLTRGVAERWIMRQMGHTSIKTFEQHYARWMDSEMPDMAATVSNLLANDPNTIPNNFEKSVSG